MSLVGSRLGSALSLETDPWILWPALPLITCGGSRIFLLTVLCSTRLMLLLPFGLGLEVCLPLLVADRSPLLTKFILLIVIPQPAPIPTPVVSVTIPFVSVITLLLPVTIPLLPVAKLISLASRSVMVSPALGVPPMQSPPLEPLPLLSEILVLPV
jgi:hypothetical protein